MDWYVPPSTFFSMLRRFGYYQTGTSWERQEDALAVEEETNDTAAQPVSVAAECIGSANCSDRSHGDTWVLHEFFSVLPPELQRLILSFLDPFSLAAVDAASRSLRCLVHQHPSLWEGHARRMWPQGLPKPSQRTDLTRLAAPYGPLQSLKPMVAATLLAARHEAALRTRTAAVSSLDVMLEQPLDETVWRVCLVGDTLLTASHQGTSRLINLLNHESVALEHEEVVWGATIDRNGGHLCATSTAHAAIFVWNSHTGHCVKTLRAHTSEVNAVGLCGDVLVSASDDGRVGVWRVSGSDKPSALLAGHADKVWGIAVEGSMAVSSSKDTTLRVWDLNHLKSSQVLRGHGKGVLYTSLQGTMCASCSHDATVRLWDVEEGRCVRTLCGHPGSVFDVQLQGNLAVSSSADGIRIWDVRADKPVRVLRTFGSVRSAAVWRNKIVTAHTESPVLRLWTF